MSDAITIRIVGLEKALKTLNALPQKIDQAIKDMIDEMLKDGEIVVRQQLAQHIETGETIGSVLAYRKGNTGIIQVGGAAVWLEFGTGTYRNHSESAEQTEFRNAYNLSEWGEYGKGMAGSGQGWYFYTDEPTKATKYQAKNGKYLNFTYGIPATHFMYNTAKYLLRNINEYAKATLEKNI